MINAILSIVPSSVLCRRATALVAGSLLALLLPSGGADTRAALSSGVHYSNVTHAVSAVRVSGVRHAGLVAPLRQRFQQELLQLAVAPHLPVLSALSAPSLPLAQPILSEPDARAYQQAFALIEQGAPSAAVATLTATTSQLLRGYVQAARLLAKDYRASYPELQQWLQAYRDQPQAEKIFVLAQQRRPRGVAAPLAPLLPTSLAHGNLDAATMRSLEARIQINERDGSPELQAMARTINERVRQGQPEAAAALLATVKDRPEFPAEWYAEGQAAVAAARFYDGAPDATQALTPDITSRSPLAAWLLGLQAWRDGRFGEAATAFGQMVAQAEALTTADLAAGYYWQARAWQKTGATGQAKAAWRKAAACSRCFYGQLAQERLGGGQHYAWATPVLTAASMADIAAHPAGRRGLALLQLGMTEAAATELRRLPLRGQADRANALMALATTAQLPALALQLGSFLKNQDGKPFDSALYPLPPWQAADAATAHATDPALVYAVMRQESRFDPTAVSSAGARGLMQLMPQTAAALDGASVAARLDEPAHNIKLGSRYLTDLAQQPDIANNVMLMLAAYNGGPGNLARWRAAASHIQDPLLFLETLPVRETRHYVQSVLSHYWMYQARLGMKRVTLQQLATGKMPTLPAVAAKPGVTQAAADGRFVVASR
jgi:soluble lytic murein transglycosylase